MTSTPSETETDRKTDKQIWGSLEEGKEEEEGSLTSNEEEEELCVLCYVSIYYIYAYTVS